MRKALLVGINRYPGQPLRGCLNDVDDMATLLHAKCGFERRSITRIVDQGATRRAIVDALREMVGGAVNGDTLLFHFSGQGTQMPNREAEDGLDEVLCPADFDWTRETALEDEELGSVFAALPRGAALLIVIDACHSSDSIKDAGAPFVRVLGTRMLRPPPWVAAEINLRSRRKKGRLRPFLARAIDDHPVVVLSACNTYQAAADAEFNGRPNGGFTYELLEALRSGGLELSLDALGKDVAQRVARFHQHPRVHGSQRLRNLPFAHEGPSLRSAEESSGAAALSSYATAIEQMLKKDPSFRAEFTDALALSARVALAAHGFEAPDRETSHRIFEPGHTVQAGPVARVFWWGFHIEIPHHDLAAFVRGASTMNDIRGAIGGGVPAAAAPWIVLVAGFIAGGLPILQALDAGRGVYVSMSWFAPGIFVPTSV